MKKVYKLEDLECAVCAAKMESAIAEIDGVESVSVNFLTQKMTLDAAAEKHDDIIKQAKKLIRRIEPDCRILA